MVLNEFVAYSQLGALKASLDPRSFTIATFALCGFANFSSIGIQLGGIGALAPSRRQDLARLGVRAMIAGTLANFVTATIAERCCDAGPLRRGRRSRQDGAGAHRRRARRRGGARLRASAPSPARSPTPRGAVLIIPHWPAAKVVGHAGEVVAGTIEGRRVLALSGRAHVYEGHAMAWRRSRSASSACSASRC